MLHGLTGRIDAGGGDIREILDFFVPFAKAATFPWKSHALWFYSQMVRWGQVAHTPENMSIARETYRPDLYRAALRPLGVALPAANAKAFTAPVLMFHGTEDRNVDVGHARLMAERLRAAGKSVEYVEFQGLAHQLSDAHARAEMLARSDAFIRQALGLDRK